MQYVLIAYMNGEVNQQASFLFNSMHEDVDTNPEHVPYMIDVITGQEQEDIEPDPRYANYRIFKQDDAPYIPERWRCMSDGCECAHCKRCGYHYDSYAAYGKDICDACQIQDARETAEAQAEAFGGNYEEAAVYFDWS
jgi:hypothetical protein